MGWRAADVVLHETSLTFDASVLELLLGGGWVRGLVVARAGGWRRIR